MSNIKMKKLLYVTIEDPFSRKSWSGVLFSIKNELIKYYDLEYLVIPLSRNFFVRFYYKIKYVVTGKQTRREYTMRRAKKTSKILSDKLSNGKYDAVFAKEISCLAFVCADIPIISYSDSTTASLMDYYYHNVSECSIRTANYIQKKSFDNSSHIIMTNKWAMDSAIRDFAISPDKITIVHTGANIEDDIYQQIEHREKLEQNVVNLLFCAVDWNRKGGDIAVDTLRTLNKIDSERKYILHIYGCTPPYNIIDNSIKLYGFLDRDDEKQRGTFYKLWENTDIFIAPVKADCAAASFCEACAYGVPSITYDTGGIADHVVNGFNGYRLPTNANPSDFANKIRELMDDPHKLNEMKMNSRRLYEDDLNWRVAGIKIRDVIMEEIQKSNQNNDY